MGGRVRRPFSHDGGGTLEAVPERASSKFARAVFLRENNDSHVTLGHRSDFDVSLGDRESMCAFRHNHQPRLYQIGLPRPCCASRGQDAHILETLWEHTPTVLRASPDVESGEEISMRPALPVATPWSYLSPSPISIATRSGVAAGCHRSSGAIDKVTAKNMRLLAARPASTPVTAARCRGGQALSGMPDRVRERATAVARHLASASVRAGTERVANAARRRTAVHDLDARVCEGSMRPGGVAGVH